MSLKDEKNPALAHFKAAFDSGRLPHSCLLTGAPDGNAGRLAEQILCMLFCGSKNDRPCGRCPNCARVLERMHPDIIWLEPRKKSRTIQREQIEDIQQLVYHTSYEGGWKAVVLINAERMNDTAANTLLKMLEEPPDATLFLLLSDDPESLLPTVASRCQRIIVPEPRDIGPDSDIKNTEAANEMVVAAMTDTRFQNGIIFGNARARLLLDFLQNIRKKLESDEKKRMSKPDTGGAADTKEILSARVEARYVAARDSLLRALLFWHRDILLSTCGADEKMLRFGNNSEHIRKMSVGLTCREAMNNILTIEEMKRRLDQHLPELTVFERGMSSLKHGG